MGKANSVGVADGGNQTMVGEGGGVSGRGGVSVGRIDSEGRQALNIIVIARNASDEAISNFMRGLLPKGRNDRCIFFIWNNQ